MIIIKGTDKNSEQTPVKIVPSLEKLLNQTWMCPDAGLYALPDSSTVIQVRIILFYSTGFVEMRKSCKYDQEIYKCLTQE